MIKAVEPVAAEPTTPEPTTAEPTTAEPTTAESTTADPAKATPAPAPPAPVPNASAADEPAKAAPAPARSGGDGDHIPEDAELSYATLPADFWGDEGGVDLAPPKGDAASTKGEPEHPPAPEADAAGDEQETEEPLRQAFAELQRLFPGRVIEVVAPPTEAEGAFHPASAVTSSDAPGAYEDDESNEDGNDEPDAKTQPAISFVPSPDEE